jgi:hypothetical protein
LEAGGGVRVRVNPSTNVSADPPRYWPLGQLILARLREFYREPEAIFWVYGFPIVMVVLLGVAFRNKPVESVRLDLIENELAKQTGACSFKTRPAHLRSSSSTSRRTMKRWHG